MLDPQSIAKKEFRTVRFAEGYDPGEVDDFLDAVHVSYTEALGKFDRAIEENTRLRALAERTQAVPESPGAGATRLLTIAQTTADGVVAEAEREADGILALAKRQAEEVARIAAEDAAVIVQKGNDERHAIIGRLEEQRSVLAERVTELQQSETTISERLRQALAALETPA